MYYKITTCVEQEEIVVFLKEFIAFDKPQNYCISVKQKEMVIFFYQDHTTTKILLMQDWRKVQNFRRNFKTSLRVLLIELLTHKPAVSF